MGWPVSLTRRSAVEKAPYRTRPPRPISAHVISNVGESDHPMPIMTGPPDAADECGSSHSEALKMNRASPQHAQGPLRSRNFDIFEEPADVSLFDALFVWGTETATSLGITYPGGSEVPTTRGVPALCSVDGQEHRTRAYE